MKRYPVNAQTCTVNGSHRKAGGPAWLGLDMTMAEPRQQSTIMMAVIGGKAPQDVHLRVPFRHPDDAIDPETFYRVRPKAEIGKKWKGATVKSVAFERWDGKWWIAVE